MLFGLTNAPSTFMRLMHHILHEFIGKVFLYFDDNLVYSKTYEDHLHHIRQVCLVLRRGQLYANLGKYEFCLEKITFLGYVVSSKGLQVDHDKLKAIEDWPTPKSATKVRISIGWLVSTQSL